MYSDEAEPGDKFKPWNKRATESDALPCVGCVRSLDIQEYELGMAQLTGAILLRMFNPHGHHLRRAGVHVDCSAGDGFWLRATLGIMLGDGWPFIAPGSAREAW
eukprot:1071346-Pyramimonas_sp.AAC.1